MMRFESAVRRESRILAIYEGAHRKQRRYIGMYAEYEYSMSTIINSFTVTDSDCCKSQTL